MRPVLCGPLSLAVDAYGGADLRPSEHLDLLVDAPERAASALARAGFAQLAPAAVAIPGADVALLLHADPLAAAAPAPPGCADLWRPARRLRVGDRVVDTVSREGDLLLAILAPAATRTDRPLQALVDVALLAARAPLDWTLVAREAARRRAIPPLRRVLGLLSSVGVAPPVGAARLERAPRREELAWWLERRRDGLAGGLPATLARYLRETEDVPPAAAARRLPGFLREAWDVAPDESLLAAAARKRRALEALAE